MRVSQRGAVLAIVVVMALLCSVAAYTALFIAESQIRFQQFWANHMQARYVAEAGMVIALQRLRNETVLAPYPPSCLGAPGATRTINEFVDMNGDGVTADVAPADGFADAPDRTAAVTVTNCGGGNRHQVSSKVTY